jgi:hypothetical protein
MATFNPSGRQTRKKKAGRPDWENFRSLAIVFFWHILKSTEEALYSFWQIFSVVKVINHFLQNRIGLHFLQKLIWSPWKNYIFGSLQTYFDGPHSPVLPGGQGDQMSL